MIIYVDLDGVLGPLPDKNTIQPSQWPGGLDTWLFGRMPIHYAPELVLRLNALQDAGAQFVWATSWQHMAVDFSNAGLLCEEWPVLTIPPQHNDRTIWWKWKVVRQDWERRGRPPFVWIDDDLRRHRNARRWVESTPNGHWISPRSEAGISPAEMDRLEAIVAKECAHDRTR
jgi:hypothetical protein